jgi:hypothetical protein
MIPARRRITVFTPGKIYTGDIDVPNALLRTTDLLNSPNLYWSDPASKSFNDSLLMHDVILSIDGIEKYQTYEEIQIRQPNIIFFHDGFAELGNSGEKERAERLKEKTREEKKTIRLITKARVNSFFDIQGTFHGLFKNKSNQNYIPISDVIMHEVIRQQDKWVKKRVQLANNFIGVNSSYIESSFFI